MYLSKEHNFAYFAIPRVGSNSAQSVLENSGISTGTEDIVYNLNDMLSSPINGENLLVEGSFEVDTLDKYHLSPTQAIERGLITVEELRQYNGFGFVRDPLQRWVSRFMLAKSFGLWEGDNVDTMILAIRNSLLEGRKDLKLSLKWNYRDYFYHDGELIITPHRLDNIDTVLSDVVSDAGGVIVGDIPQIQLGNTLPEELREPIDTWLPNDCVSLLRSFFEEDIEFYESLL